MSLLYPYQKKLITNNSRLTILKKSRQIGGSFSYGFKAVHSAIFKKRNQLIVSASQRQSRIVMSYVEKFIKAFSYLEEFKGLKLETDQTIEKKFTDSFGGASVFCLPPNPETIRGFNGDVLLDEYALYKNDKKIYEAILPVILRGFDLNIQSTCFGMQNMFYEIFANEIKYKDFERKSINIYDAIEQGLNVDIELIKNNFDSDSFRQEFECEFIDESTSYFPYNLLRELIEDFEESSIKGNCYIGIDVGRVNDRTAIIVLRQVGNVFYLIRREELQNTKFDEQIEIISQIFYEEQPEKVMIDKTGIGLQLSETLEERFGFVEGVHFTNTFISEIVTNAKKIFEQKNFKFNEDRDLISQIHSVNKEITANNSVTFKSKRDGKGHNDSAYGLFMALYCNKHEYSPKIAFI